MRNAVHGSVYGIVLCNVMTYYSVTCGVHKSRSGVYYAFHLLVRTAVHGSVYGIVLCYVMTYYSAMCGACKS